MLSRFCNCILNKPFHFLACLAITVCFVQAIPVYPAEAGSSFQDDQKTDGEVKIIQSWSGDYPVASLDLLPEDQRGRPAGFINNPETFAALWKFFKPDEAVPEVDFNNDIVLFARNSKFYNRLAIGQVVVKNGIAEALAMETMSALPIEDKVGISFAVIPRKEIKGIQAGDDIIRLPNN